MCLRIAINEESLPCGSVPVYSVVGLDDFINSDQIWNSAVLLAPFPQQAFPLDHLCSRPFCHGLFLRWLRGLYASMYACQRLLET